MSIEPKPVIPLEYAQSTTFWRGRGWRIATLAGAWVSALCVVVGWAAMFVDVETVVISGAILALSGTTLAVAAWRLNLLPGLLLGIAHVSICVLFVVLVNIWQWSPRDATIPFRVMTGIYLLALVLPGTIFTLVHMHVKRLSGIGTAGERGL